MNISGFDELWVIDFEFHQPHGERPKPICMVGQEALSGRAVRLTETELEHRRIAPIPTGRRCLIVCYYAAAEMACFLALGWPLPERVLDLYAEFRWRTNGRDDVEGRGLLAALAHFGLPWMSVSEKESMRSLAMRGGPFTSEEVNRLIDYCQADVEATVSLLNAMIGEIDLPRALLRGRYTQAVARMEAVGVPIDTEFWISIRDGWERVRRGLIDAVEKEYRVAGPEGPMPIFDGTTFKRDRFERYLGSESIAWPRLTTGALDLSEETFRQMAKIHHRLSNLRETRHALAQLRLADLTVGRDGRNRCLLSPFSSRTSRNQPSNVKFIFGPSVWLRGLIRPAAGTAIAYLDWSGQEYGIAAALSGDQQMMADYLGGDPYLDFARRTGAVPADATKRSHPAERERFKVALGLGAMYGAGPDRVAGVIGGQPADAADLLRRHRLTYPTFWRWRDCVVSHAMMHGELQTLLGWRLQVGPAANPRSLANFPMQGNGAEMLRLACSSATEAGIRVCCPVHDAVLVEAPVGEINRVVAETASHMARASRDVLGGFELRTGAEVIAYPNRFRDEKRGGAMWDRVVSLLGAAERA